MPILFVHTVSVNIYRVLPLCKQEMLKTSKIGVVMVETREGGPISVRKAIFPAFCTGRDGYSRRPLGPRKRDQELS